MALSEIKNQYMSRDTHYYRDAYPRFILATFCIILVILVVTGFLAYQLRHRPSPSFYAIKPDGHRRSLVSYEEPNLLPDTIIRFASKATTTAYTFSFNEIANNLALARPYFTEAGWAAYRASVGGLINSVVKNQLFVNGIVLGVPVISNQGVLPGSGYTWRIQVPFLVIYQSANTSTTQKYYVVVTIVKVPTYINPRGIGIDQFVMMNG